MDMVLDRRGYERVGIFDFGSSGLRYTDSQKRVAVSRLCQRLDDLASYGVSIIYLVWVPRYAHFYLGTIQSYLPIRISGDEGSEFHDLRFIHP
jgi:arginyl-tRNA--protein-N-Asp/Glu arginylyltransferase